MQLRNRADTVGRLRGRRRSGGRVGQPTGPHVTAREAIATVVTTDVTFRPLGDADIDWYAGSLRRDVADDHAMARMSGDQRLERSHDPLAERHDECRVAPRAAGQVVEPRVALGAELLEGDVGYVSLEAFQGNSAVEFAGALRALRAKGVDIDLMTADNASLDTALAKL